VRACAPGDDHADADGCVSGPSASDGVECTDEEDPCTDDVCRDGTCAHDDVADMAGCTPVRAPFRRARGLLALARTLDVRMTPAADSTAPGTLGPGPLHVVELDLEAAARALAGKTAASAAGASPGTTAQRRARVAVSILRPTPGRVASALRRARTSLDATAGRQMREPGRELLRGTRALRNEVRRLTRVTGTLVR
jgi:hypothetical protein